MYSTFPDPLITASILLWALMNIDADPLICAERSFTEKFFPIKLPEPLKVIFELLALPFMFNEPEPLITPVKDFRFAAALILPEPLSVVTNSEPLRGSRISMLPDPLIVSELSLLAEM